MGEAERIAASLSEAQKRALLDAEEIVVGELSVCTDAATEYELALGGLLNDMDGDALTPLGLAVRSILQGEKPAIEGMRDG